MSGTGAGGGATAGASAGTNSGGSAGTSQPSPSSTQRTQFEIDRGDPRDSTAGDTSLQRFMYVLTQALTHSHTT